MAPTLRRLMFRRLGVLAFIVNTGHPAWKTGFLNIDNSKLPPAACILPCPALPLVRLGLLCSVLRSGRCIAGSTATYVLLFQEGRSFVQSTGGLAACCTPCRRTKCGTHLANAYITRPHAQTSASPSANEYSSVPISSSPVVPGD